MSETNQRKKRIIELDDALAKVKDGMTIAIGGFINSSHPMLVVRGLIRRGVKNLTVVGPASSGLEIDLLIAASVAKKVVAPYVGGEVLALQGIVENEAHVSRAHSDAPKVPSYAGGKFPLSTYLAARVRRIRSAPSEPESLGR